MLSYHSRYVLEHRKAAVQRRVIHNREVVLLLSGTILLIVDCELSGCLACHGICHFTISHAMSAWSSAEQGEIMIVLDITTEIFHRR